MALDFIIEYLIIAIVVLSLINLIVTRKVIKRDLFTASRKVLQIVLVWLIPLFGAILVFLFHKDDETPKGPDKPDFGAGYGESGSVI